MKPILGPLVAAVQDLPFADAIAGVLQPAIKNAFLATPGGRVFKTALHGPWIGHALHPILTDLPIGAWTMAAVLDLAEKDDAADLCIGLGILTAAPTALTGLNDWTELYGRPARVGVAHATFNIAATLLYTAAYATRRHRGQRRFLAYCGLGAMLLGAYLGGHLAFGEQVGPNHAVAEGLPTEFTPVLGEQELAEGQPKRAQLGERNIVLVKRAGRIVAMLESCSHMGGPLAEGTVEGDAIRCPWHGSLFSLEDGSVVQGPATVAQPIFETQLRNGQVEVRARSSEAP
jgi:nitrite reductase/ring-hydroxylating ferredoxin subunit